MKGLTYILIVLVSIGLSIFYINFTYERMITVENDILEKTNGELAIDIFNRRLYDNRKDELVAIGKSAIYTIPVPIIASIFVIPTVLTRKDKHLLTNGLSKKNAMTIAFLLITFFTYFFFMNQTINSYSNENTPSLINDYTYYTGDFIQSLVFVLVFLPTVLVIIKNRLLINHFRKEGIL